LALVPLLAARADEPPADFVPPKLLEPAPPHYPPTLAEEGIEGEVLLEIDVDEKGVVGGVKVVKTSGYPEMDEAALAAALALHFSPGSAGGKPAAARITYRDRFVLSKAPTPTENPALFETPKPKVEGVPFSGVVREKGTRTELAGIEVAIAGVEESALTDEKGNFSFPNVPFGKRKVSLRGTGYVAADTEEQFTRGKKLTAIYYILANDRYRTVVRREKLVKQTTEQTLDIEEIKKIPGTQGDALKAVQTLPGVARAPFGLGQLIVWGSSPLDTRTYVDGVYIPTLYHFGGLRSTVNAELVQSLSFTPGAYGADYGRGLGGVVEIETRRPKENGIHGYVALDLIDGSLLLEGPLGKDVSFAIAARRSWIDVFLPLFTTNDFQLSPKYWDYQAALRWKASPRDDLDLFLFGSDDSVDVILKNADPDLSASLHSHTFYHRLLARWTHRFENGTTFTLTPSVGYDVPFEVNAQIGPVAFHVDPAIISYNLKAILRTPVTSFLRLDVGLDFEGNVDPFDVTGTPQGMPREGDALSMGTGGFVHDSGTLYLTTAAPYVVANFSFLDKKLNITPGVRLELYHLGGYYGTDSQFEHDYVELEPRLALRYQIHPMVAVKAAAGAYHQPPDPSSLARGFGNSNVKPESAYQYLAGFDVTPTPTLHIELVGFYKDMQSLIVRSPIPSVILDNEGQGRVYGGEILIRQQLWKGFFGWLSYTLSRAERRDHGSDWRPFDFDQTHILSVLASYQLPKGWQIGARFRYVTGNPYTPSSGAYWDNNSDQYVRLAGPINSGRLDSFQQLDLRIDKTFTYRWWKLGIYLDIQNVYNHANTEQVQPAPRPEDGTAPIAGLPIIPSLGVRGEF
jgi:TonB family protein